MDVGGVTCDSRDQRSRARSTAPETQGLGSRSRYLAQAKSKAREPNHALGVRRLAGRPKTRLDGDARASYA